MYRIVKKAISKELAKFCYDYFCTKRKVARFFLDTKRFSFGNSSLNKIVELFGWGKWEDSQILNTYSNYGDVAIETLLLKLQPLIEAETGMQLSPTYTYARIYKKGDILKRHKDRFSCEISATLNLGGDPWPIFLEPTGKEGEEGISILLQSGDLLIYEGCKLEHWRETFKGEICSQAFLHYNDLSSNKAEENKYDKRPFIRLPDIFIENNL